MPDQDAAPCVAAAHFASPRAAIVHSGASRSPSAKVGSPPTVSSRPWSLKHPSTRSPAAAMVFHTHRGTVFWAWTILDARDGHRDISSHVTLGGPLNPPEIGAAEPVAHATGTWPSAASRPRSHQSQSNLRLVYTSHQAWRSVKSTSVPRGPSTAGRSGLTAPDSPIQTGWPSHAGAKPGATTAESRHDPEPRRRFPQAPVRLAHPDHIIHSVAYNLRRLHQKIHRTHVCSGQRVGQILHIRIIVIGDQKRREVRSYVLWVRKRHMLRLLRDRNQMD